MKPIKNRVFCTDCGRVKMLFPSEEKAQNFMAFNADEIMADGKAAPCRSYFCPSCGGWHVTKSLKSEFFKERNEEKIKKTEVISRISAVVNEFHTSYDKTDPGTWRKKLMLLRESLDELDRIEPGLTPEKSKARKCINQYEISIIRAEKKKLNIDNNSPENLALFRDLKSAAYNLNWGRCVYLACLLNATWGKKVRTADVTDKLNALNDFITPGRVAVLKKLFGLSLGLKESVHLMSADEIRMSFTQVSDLYRQACSSGVTSRHLKGVRDVMQSVSKRWPDLIAADTQIDSLAGDAEGQAAVQMARTKVIEAIDLLKAGQIDRAEDVLQVAAVYLEGYEDTPQGIQVGQAMQVVSEQVVSYRDKKKY